MDCPPTTFVLLNPELSSNISRGRDIARLMQAAGHDVDHCLLPETVNKNLSNRILVFHKPRGMEIPKLRCRGIIIDLVDDKRLFYEERISELIQKGVHGIVFPNRHSMLRLGKGNAAFGVIHGTSFHIPQSIQRHTRPFCVGYFGSPTEASHIQCVGDKLVRANFRNDLLFSGNESKLSKYLANMAACPFHMNIRNKKDKPPNKTIVAARCGSAIILSRDSGGSEDLLPPDYPYWTKGTEPDDIREALQFAQDTYLGPVWDKAMVQMKAVVDASTDDKIVDTYVDILFRTVEIANDR